MLSFTRKFGWFAAIALCMSFGTARTLVAQPADEAAEAAAEADEAAHEAAETEAAGDPNPLAFRTDLALWTFVVFVVLFGLLSYFAWPHIAEALDARERSIAESIAAARLANEEAKRLVAEHEARLAAAAGEVRALLEEARRDAEATRGRILSEAQKERQQELQRALREIELAKDGAIQELAVVSANVAVELARKVIREKLTSDEQSKLVRTALEKLTTAAPSPN